MRLLRTFVLPAVLACATGLQFSCSTTPRAAAGELRSAAMPTGFLNKDITVAGKTYRYVVYVPHDYDASKPSPAIVFLHGAGECGTDGLKHVGQGIGTAIMHDASAWPFVVVMPQKPEVGKQWEDYDAAVMEMLKATEHEYTVDTNRVYLTGLSQGGHGTWTLGAKHADIWAAIAPICGYGNSGHDGKVEVPDGLVDRVKALPIWAFHGDADSAVSVEHTKKIIASLQAASADAKATIYPGVNHNSWDKAYREEHLGEWFLQHARGKQAMKAR